jgi:hypothetical protein
MDVQLGKVAPPPAASGISPFASGWNYMGHNAAGVASGVRTENRTQAQIDASLNLTATGIASAPLWVPVAGAAAAYSPLGFAVGVGGDAVGQAFQSYSATGQVTIRPAQSIAAGVTAAIALPLEGILAAVGMSAKGAASIAGGAAVGGVTAATDALFNNIYYDEATSLLDAGVQGAMFGAFGHSFGRATGKLLRRVMPKPVRSDAPAYYKMDAFSNIQGHFLRWSRPLVSMHSNYYNDCVECIFMR